MSRFSKSHSESLRWWQWTFGVVVPSVILYSTFVAPTMEFDQEKLPLPVAEMSLKAIETRPSIPSRAAAARPAVEMPLKVFEATPSPAPANPRVLLLIEQHRKCADEIKMRLEQEEQWFHYKVAFIGVMFAGYILRTILGEPKGDASKELLPPKLLRDVFKHVSTLVLIGTCCAVCIITDMHIRANRIVINENGSWIATVAEPIIFGMSGGRIIGWERFLRVEGGYHMDPLFHLLFWPEIFLVTVAVYAAYSYVFFWQMRSAETVNSATRRLEDRLRIGSYWILHILILFCALCTHYTPPNFLLRPWWWFGVRGLHPNWMVWGYFELALLALCVSGLTWLVTARKREESRAAAGEWCI